MMGLAEKEWVTGQESEARLGRRATCLREDWAEQWAIGVLGQNLAGDFCRFSTSRERLREEDEEQETGNPSLKPQSAACCASSSGFLKDQGGMKEGDFWGTTV